MVDGLTFVEIVDFNSSKKNAFPKDHETKSRKNSKLL